MLFLPFRVTFFSFFWVVVIFSFALSFNAISPLFFLHSRHETVQSFSHDEWSDGGILLRLTPSLIAPNPIADEGGDVSDEIVQTSLNALGEWSE